jgi:hypothetical protein
MDEAHKLSNFEDMGVVENIHLLRYKRKYILWWNINIEHVKYITKDTIRINMKFYTYLIKGHCNHKKSVF